MTPATKKSQRTQMTVHAAGKRLKLTAYRIHKLLRERVLQGGTIVNAAGEEFPGVYLYSVEAYEKERRGSVRAETASAA